MLTVSQAIDQAIDECRLDAQDWQNRTDEIQEELDRAKIVRVAVRKLQFNRYTSNIPVRTIKRIKNEVDRINDLYLTI